MELIIAPRNTGEPARDYAYRVLSENIAKLKLYPGCPLNDQEVAVRLGISRTPVREAINQIKNESDIIEIYPQRGMKISLIDTGIINQVRDLRVMLEKRAMRLCCKNRSEEDPKWMDDNIALQNFYFERGEVETAMEQDDLLHRKIFEIAGMEYIHRMTRGLMLQYNRVRVLETFYDSYGDSINDHQAIVDAIRQQDPRAVEKLVDIHLGRWADNERKLRKQYPEYFLEEVNEK